MKKLFRRLLMVLLISPLFVAGQQGLVNFPVHADVSIPLREMKPATKPFWQKWFKKTEEREVPNKFTYIPPISIPFDDEARQINYPAGTDAPLANLLVNVSGSSNNQNVGYLVTPPDPTGDVGPNHYVQTVNSLLQVFNKSGVSVFGPVATSTLWSGFNGPWNGHNDGDAVVLYDENADRWLISQFAIDCGASGSYTEYELIAISTSPDPTGSYYRYAYQFDYMPDYPKIGVWNDGYYMAINRFNTNSGGTFIGAAGCVMERNLMLIGDPAARLVYFKTETLGGSGSGNGSSCYSMLPSDCDGTFPSAGTPNYFTYIPSSSGSELRIWSLHTDWTNIANSTFTYVTALAVTAFTRLATGGTGVVPQQGASAPKLDGLGDRLMFRNQYRNFGSYETFVTCHNVSTGGISGVRWYEYRKVGSAFSIYQQGTYAPADGKWRWLGSIAMNSIGDIGLAYTVSSSSMYPSIYYTGRKSADALGSMTVTEGIIQTGTNYITGASRWGDYSAMNIDPADNLTFWTTNEYIGTGTPANWPWTTRIASFKIANSPATMTLDATSITSVSGTLNGSVNPNGLSTTYYFEWGPTTAYGNTTSSQSAGSGATSVPVSAAIAGLTTGTTYHFRIKATNSGGTSTGNDLFFTPGIAVIITTPPSSITQTTAASGGNITTDGGAAVTVRGVCWSTSINPTITDSHTTDGSGTGSFTSSIAGLTANSSYHLRAYATNANGTSYGLDQPFTTVCSIVTLLPFLEDFETHAYTPSCWNEENANPYWMYINGDGNGFPASAHSGTKNACLIDGSTADNKNKLITPVFDLSLYNNVILTFYHTQAVWGSDQDQLKVYYRTSSGGVWTQLASYTASITSWTLETITLPNLGSYYQVAFEGNAKYGYGVCLDDISLKAPGNWIGGTSGNLNTWETATNWGDGNVPNGTTDVYIPPRTYLPVVTTTTATCRNLVIETGAGMTVNAPQKITLLGNMTMIP
ncbi:MAG: hypothetical protein NTW10_12510 [Bacteroidetes bacterium]|nr:hypothetical protein [Bacteroidota bacterium]